MDPRELVEALGDEAAWPPGCVPVEVLQTHCSVVFLAGADVFKVKKPVNLGFLDYSTLARRKAACEAELRLNRRLAPDVYLGAVPVTRARGGLALGGRGEIVDWAVHMRRLPAEATFDARLAAGRLGEEELALLARRLALFHAGAERGPDVQRDASFDRFAAVVRGNLEQARACVGATLDAAVHARLVERTEAELERRRPLLEERHERGLPCDGHGDLRLEHVYLLDGAAGPEVVLVDCIEFDDSFRRADPAGDVGFVAMDLEFAGRRSLADAFVRAYADAAADPRVAELVPLHVAYRHVVRGKVRGIEARETEVDAESRARAAARSRAHFLAALSRLERPDLRPALVLVSGLPGTGKSTLARALAARCGFERVSSDEMRKSLAGAPPEARGLPLYSQDWTERTYAALLSRARAALLAGGRVLVDASFHRRARREAFRALAAELRLPFLVLWCRAPRDLALARLASRRGDASDADAGVHEAMSSSWEPFDDDEPHAALDAACGADAVTEQACAVLGRWGLLAGRD